MLSKKVLIVSYIFPPADGIGGRRWVKFAKYFVKKGLDVQIIAAEYDKKGKISPWNEDSKDIGDRVTWISSGYPKKLGVTPLNIIGKIGYRIALVYAKIKLKGNYYDKGGYWKRKLNEEVERKIKEGYNNVIVSVAPFRSAYFISELKIKYPNVNFIVDFRDPWINNKTAYGFDVLKGARLKFEERAEKEVALKFDKIVSVSDDMSDYFAKKYHVANKCMTIPNGFDADDFGSFTVEKRHDKMIFVFAGTFYTKAKYLLDRLSVALEEIKKEVPSIYEKLQFEFYGNVSFDVKSYLRIHQEIIFFHGVVDKTNVLEKVAGADICLLFLTDDLTYSFSTKFCDYIAMNKMIGVISKKGKTASFVEENEIGIYLNPDYLKDDILNVYKLKNEGRLLFNNAFDKSEFNVEELSNRYICLLQ